MSQPHPSPVPNQSTSHRCWTVLRGGIIIIFAIGIMGVLIRVASIPVNYLMETLIYTEHRQPPLLPEEPIYRDHVRPVSAGTSPTTVDRPLPSTKLLGELKEGESGYIKLADIHPHPFIDVYIGDDTAVSPTLTATHRVKITINDRMIIIDPPSVQRGLRYVAWGPIADADRRIMTSPKWWNHTLPPPQEPEPSPPMNQ